MKIKSGFSGLVAFIHNAAIYIFNMVMEHSSLASISAGAIAAAALPKPFCYFVLGAALLGVFRKEKGEDRLPCSQAE